MLMQYMIPQMYWAAALHAYTPLPLLHRGGTISDKFRLHAFVNTGNMGDFILSKSWVYRQFVHLMKGILYIIVLLIDMYSLYSTANKRVSLVFSKISIGN